MSEGIAAFPRADWREGKLQRSDDTTVEELPVALVYNGVSHAVMMATPTDLEDLALGFSLSEHILEHPDQLLDVEVSTRGSGVEVSMRILAERFEALKTRRRSMAGPSGCGLCGIESLEQATPRLPAVTAGLQVSHAAIQSALAGLQQRQQLKQRTGGVHGAAWCRPDGEIVAIREDVGRHNAMDKILGARARRLPGPGFVLLTSRIGYELVAKAAFCNVPLIAAVSAPTSLAIEAAERAGVSLVAYVQAGRHVIYSGEQRLVEGGLDESQPA